jgi:hypothetical protein
MRTISVVLCLVCLGCTAISPPAPLMRAPAATPSFTATTRSTPVNQPQERLLPAVVEDDDEICRTGIGD